MDFLSKHASLVFCSVSESHLANTSLNTVWLLGDETFMRTQSGGE